CRVGGIYQTRPKSPHRGARFPRWAGSGRAPSRRVSPRDGTSPARGGRSVPGREPLNCAARPLFSGAASMSTRFFAAFVFALACLAGSAAVSAEALIKPVPTPDLSRLPAEKAADLRLTRTTFDVKRKELIGPALAEAYALLGAAYASN